MADGAAPCELITIPISHYCEKARWALDRARIPYRERAHLQVMHIVAVHRAGGGRTAPVLVCGDLVLADSGDILEHADRRMAHELRLYPEDAALCAEVRALEADFNDSLGPEARRWIYHELAPRDDLARKYGTTGVPSWQRRVLPAFSRLMFGVINGVLDVTPQKAAESEQEVRATFDRVGARLADGRSHLCGDRFTAADLTFSALAAPVIVPEQYGVPLPRIDELPAHTAAVVREMREHPAGRHALAMYRDERRR